MQKSKVKFFLDVDGVVLDFDAGFRSMFRQKYPDVYDPAGHSFDLTAQLVKTGRIPNSQHLYNYFLRSPYFSKLPMLPDTEYIKKLFNLGEVYFITNIPTASIEFRRQNLTAYGIPDCGIFPAGEENYGEKNYPLKSAAISGLYREEDTAFFLDDITRNYDDVQTCLPAIHTYLIRSFENNHLELPGYKIVDNFAQFVTVVETIIKER